MRKCSHAEAVLIVGGGQIQGPLVQSTHRTTTSLPLPPRLCSSQLPNRYYLLTIFLRQPGPSRLFLVNTYILFLQYRPCTGPPRHNQPAGLPVVHARRSPMLPRPSPAPSARPSLPNPPQRSYLLSKSPSRAPLRSRNHLARLNRPPFLLPQHNRHRRLPRPPPRPQRHHRLVAVHRDGPRRRRSLRFRMRRMQTARMMPRRPCFTLMRRPSLLRHALT